MPIEERAELAAELKKSGKYNCTQSVVKVFENELPVEPDTLLQLTAGFAAGMGCMESTCGALIGAVLVAGALTGGTGTPASPSSCCRRSSRPAVRRFVRTSKASRRERRCAAVRTASAMRSWPWAVSCRTDSRLSP